MHIGNVLLIYRTKCTLSRTKIHAQNKSDKIVFSKRRATRRLEKNDFVLDLFNQSDILKCPTRTNCALSGTKKHTQNKSSDLYIGQIAVWKKTTYAPSWTFSRHSVTKIRTSSTAVQCQVDVHVSWSQNRFFPNGVWRAVWKKRFCPTYFARVFWSDLEYILSDIYVRHFQYTYRTN